MKAFLHNATPDRITSLLAPWRHVVTQYGQRLCIGVYSVQRG